QDDVESDRRSTLVRQPIYRQCEHGARPWPLAELADTFVIDVDDRDGARVRGARPDLLIGVEDQKVEAVDRARWGEGGSDDHGHGDEARRPDREIAAATGDTDNGCQERAHRTFPKSPEYTLEVTRESRETRQAILRRSLPWSG